MKYTEIYADNLKYSQRAALKDKSATTYSYYYYYHSQIP